MVRIVPLGRAPAAVVVTVTWGSPASAAPLRSLSNQTTPVVFGPRPLPVMAITVPGTPEVGLRVMLELGTVKLAEASMLPLLGTSALTM